MKNMRKHLHNIKVCPFYPTQLCHHGWLATDGYCLMKNINLIAVEGSIS